MEYSMRHMTNEVAAIDESVSVSTNVSSSKMGGLPGQRPAMKG